MSTINLNANPIFVWLQHLVTLGNNPLFYGFGLVTFSIIGFSNT